MTEDLATAEIESGLDALAGQAEQLDAIADDPNPAPAPAQPSPPAIEDEQRDQAMTTLVSVVFAVIAARRGAHWTLQEPEAQALGKAYGDLLAQWLPPETFGVGMTALVVSVGVIGPRVIQDKAQRHESPDRPGGAEHQHPGDRGERIGQDDLDPAADQAA